jgi:PAS domain S-box-containing protein
MDLQSSGPAAEALQRKVRELERALAEQAARHEAERRYFVQLEALIDRAPLATYLKDAEHRYLLVNREYERLSNCRREDVLGKTDFDVFPQPVAQLFRSQDEAVRDKGAPVDFRETIPLPDGEHSFITSKFPLDGPGGGVAGVCTEITELLAAQRRLETTQADLVRRERLATLGELAAMVAHEVRNPLGVIFNALATLRRVDPAGADAHSMHALIGDEAERLDRMVTALLELARPGDAALAPTVVAEVLRDAIDAARVVSQEEGEVRLDLPPSLPVAPLDAQKLQLAVTNLVTNALQAPKRRGPVVVRASVESGAPAMLRIEVVDDGVGVPPQLAERVFTPFFTLRAKGTGLGLAVVRRVAEAHRGTATHEPTPGGGATFVVRVPL